DAERPSLLRLDRLEGAQLPVLADDDDLARLHLALVLRADEVERARLGGHDPVPLREPAEAERAEAVRVAERGELAAAERDARVRPLEPRHRRRDRVLERPVLRRDERGDRLRVRAGRAGEAELGAEERRVDEVAVVAERDRPGTTVMDERLRVRPLVAAGGRVADVADRDLAAKPAEGLLRERLGDEPELAQRRRAAVI